MLNRGSAPPAEDRAVEGFFAQIIDSETFRGAPMMRTLLIYLWKNQGRPLGEYAIGVDALGRPEDLDPRTDSTVRVQIARLRAKLKQFYETAGESFPLRLSIPLGRHELTCTYLAPETPAADAGPETRQWTWVAAGVLITVMVAVCGWLGWENYKLKNADGPAASLPGVWQKLGSPDKPWLVVVPSPLYFFWPERDVYVRDLGTSNFVDWPKSAVIQELSRKWGPPELAQTYVGAMEMSSGVRLLQFLDRHVRQAQLVESRKFSREAMASHNTIFLGMPRTTAGYLDGLTENTNFYIAGVDPDVVRNREPKSGERAEFREVAYSTDRRLYPAILVAPPPRPDGSRCLILFGRFLTGLTSMLATAEGLEVLQQELAKVGSPESWEMVIEAEVYRDTLLKTKPVAIRALSQDFWKWTDSTAAPRSQPAQD